MKCPKCNFENPADTLYCGKCAAPLLPSEDISAPLTETLETPKEELTTGSTFAGRYQIIEELGKGGMGKVYKAQDTDLKEKVAIKLLRPEIAGDKKTIERFRNELKFARKIRHKNVCQMYDLNKEKGAHYITMEYVDGKDLKSMIRMMGQLSSGKTIFIAKQVCEGLVEAHRLGVIHRDLKPQNIMVDEDGNARIMDFGIARSLKTKGITAAGVMIGTPEYMSPEQVEGKEVDQRSDIYSLGIILYEMVTGRVPFEGDTPFTIGVKHKSEMPKDPKELNTQLPEDLNLVILRCLEKDKEKRYQSAGEVRAELTRIEKGIPTTEIEIPKKKPLTSREITVTFGIKKLFIPAIIVVALIIAAVVIWQLLPKKEAIPIAPSDKPSIAILYFENNTGDEKLDHWRKALSELMIADLSQSKYIKVLSGDRIFNILRELNLLESKSYSSEDLKKVAAQGGVENVLRGSYTKAGNTLRINLMLQKASSGELIGSERVESNGEEGMFAAIDELTRKIKANFKLSEKEISSDLDEEVGKITTSSPEAYRYYSEGRKYHITGENRKSIELMERAIAIDPEFAMAYRSMAMSYNNLFLFSERTKYIQKALELANRLTERERYNIEGGVYSGSEMTYDKAIEAYNKLLKLYPEDTIANGNLALIYYGLEEWDKAIERYEVNRKAKDKFMYTYTQLADAFGAKGMYGKAKEILEASINNISDHFAIHQQFAYSYIEQGEFDLALTAVEKAFYLNPTHYENFMIKGCIYLYRGDFIKAEEEYRELFGLGESVAQVVGLRELTQLYGLQGKFEKAKSQRKLAIELAKKVGQHIWESVWHLDAARGYLISGNYEEALKECDEAWESAIEANFIAGQRRALYIKGLVFLEMDSMKEAQKIANDLKVMIEKGMYKKTIRLHHHLMGMIELQRGNYIKAIENLKKAISLLSYGPLTKRADFIDSLALAYIKSGNLDKAREEYEKITALTTGRFFYGDIYAKSFYMLGKVYQDLGDEAKARDYYEKFLELWKDADPGIPEVEDAKKRLAALKSL
jgi:serine/threonine protein kinase/predicted Zn-dependent protease